MICSSGGTIVFATGNLFPRLPIKNSSGCYVNGTRNRRSSMSVDAVPIRLRSSHKRKRNIGCGVSPSSPTTTTTTVVDEQVAVRRNLAMRRVLEDNGGDGSSVRDFSLFTSKRGDTLFTQSWTPVDSAKNRSIPFYYLFCLLLMIDSIVSLILWALSK